ncbi:MAG TPA: hypothetical protein VNZ22_14135, partial [Bacillota bacterium]|nr:hypothetical protein [Bacillota bacterium]
TPSPQTSGSFTLVVTAKGTCSGSLKLGAARYALTGRFNSTGEATLTIPRLYQRPLKVQLHLDLANSTGQITGSVSTTVWTADLSGTRAN